MLGIASAVITALGSVATSLIGGYLQTQQLEEGEAASKEQYLGEMAESRRRFSQELALSNARTREQKREFDLSYGLNKKQIQAQQNQTAHEAVRNQYSTLTSILDKNENLKSLYLDRLKGLRS